MSATTEPMPHTAHVFHPKLALFIAEDRARAILGSANMTRGGFERNLELGSAIDLHPQAVPDPSSYHCSITSGVRCAVKPGDELTCLERIAVALGEVIDQSSAEPESSPHICCTTMSAPLWDQLLAKLPHRILRRAAIISPFFEPDTTAGETEDPPSNWRRLQFSTDCFPTFEFETNSEEKPALFFSRRTAEPPPCPLPNSKLGAKAGSPGPHLATSDDARRLHGKLIVLEGSGKSGREPFLVALHGSPNFSSAPSSRLHQGERGTGGVDPTAHIEAALPRL